MVKVYDVPADRLIEELAQHLRRVPEIEPPTWASFVKTGSHADRPPQRQDWWYVRAASIMRKVYMRGPVGIEKLESAYGGSKQLAYFPKHHRDAGSSSIRNLLKGLEKAELVSKQQSGRVLTPKGVALMDKVSKEIFKELVKQNPALERYS
ncbi:MAG: 30S ribosomal protein S19e [Nitrososphaerota archaeon]|jgi:small subunit ribosomal protein S19e|nr:30S ribosomal protein S19e [Nitrososphaerota archaeon]MDG6966181.1 30S ribosomal protein S19e [Nitrososphaerota archaeon]MDG6977616.1 30S ribosomal protein S19e [Nitrososphaerota archaeon]MDG7020357.1 30S ribosomal protein S19e [Nitrososphaerota archaeon]